MGGGGAGGFAGVIGFGDDAVIFDDDCSDGDFAASGCFLGKLEGEVHIFDIHGDMIADLGGDVKLGRCKIFLCIN